MLTVRHIEESGHESITPAHRVWSEPGDQVGGGTRNVFADIGKDHPLHFVTGQIYVMNDNGKTVATYAMT